MGESIGKKDRAISIERQTPGAEDDYGQSDPEAGWVEVAAIFSRVVWVDSRGTLEEVNSAKLQSPRQADFIFRYQEVRDLKETDRIIYNGETFNITRINERGGREDHFTVRAYAVDRNAPGAPQE